MTRFVEILAEPIIRARPAVADIAASIWEAAEQAANLRSEWMVLPIPRLMEPQDRLLRFRPRERVQHGEDRRDAELSGERVQELNVKLPRGKLMSRRSPTRRVRRQAPAAPSGSSFTLMR